MATFVPSKVKRTIATQKVIDAADIDGMDAILEDFEVTALPPLRYERFDASGTWMRPEDVEVVFVRLHSAGQGGGRRGGNSGEFKQGFVTVTGAIAVTVGQGGAGSDGAGESGGSSSFGVLLSSLGGGGAPEFDSFIGLDMFIPSFAGSSTGKGTDAGYPGGPDRGGAGSMFGAGGSNGSDGTLGSGGGGISAGDGGDGGDGFVEVIWLK